MGGRVPLRRVMAMVAGVLLALLLLPSLAGSASAGEQGIRRYLATTSDGQALRLRTVRDHPSRRLDAVFFGSGRSSGAEGFLLTCDDGTTKPPVQGGWTQWPWFLDQDGHVIVNEDVSSRRYLQGFHLEGTFERDTASGTLRYNEVRLNPDETLRVCTTGDLTWTAERAEP